VITKEGEVEGLLHLLQHLGVVQGEDLRKGGREGGEGEREGTV